MAKISRKKILQWQSLCTCFFTHCTCPCPFFLLIWISGYCLVTLKTKASWNRKTEGVECGQHHCTFTPAPTAHLWPLGYMKNKGKTYAMCLRLLLVASLILRGELFLQLLCSRSGPYIKMKSCPWVEGRLLSEQTKTFTLLHLNL